MPGQLRTGVRSYGLVDLDLQGRVFRYTDAPKGLDVADSNGQTYRYEGGANLPPYQRTTGEISRSLQVEIEAGTPVGGVTWARLLARGHSIEWARVIVRRHYEGETFDEASTWLRGRATEVAYGGPDEPLTFTVEQVVRSDGVMPRSDMVVDATTWPDGHTGAGATRPDDVTGAVYPLVLGAPTSACTPGYLVGYDAFDNAKCWLLIAGHRVTASSVTLHDPEAGTSATRTVRHAKDDRGRTIAYVDFDGLAWVVEKNHEYRVAWDQGGAGAAPVSRTGHMTGAGDVIEYLLRTWTSTDFDWNRWSKHRERLTAYRIGHVVTDFTRVWDYIESTLLPILPAEIVETPDGLLIREWGLRSTRRDVVGHIDCSRPFGRYDRVGRVSLVGGPVANEFTVAYAPGGAQMRMRGTVTVGAFRNLDDARRRPNFRCLHSNGIYERMPAGPFSTEAVHDGGTAQRIGEDRALLAALKRRALRVEGDMSLDRYEDGDAVTVTATDLEIEDEVAIVRDRSLDGDVAGATLLLLDSPTTMTRPVVP